MTVLIREKNVFSSEELDDIQELESHVLLQGQEVSFLWKNNQYWLFSHNPKEKPISVEIDAEIENHLDFFKKSSLYHELMAKAVGVKPQFRPEVFDLTAGLLGDSLKLVAMGCKVRAYERNPIVHFLLKYALKNASHPLIKNLELVYEDASNALSRIREHHVVFYDPMFEDFNDKAAPKKEMRIFRSVVGVDPDSKILVTKILEKKVKRLVIKRPRHSVELIEKEATKYLGKSIRYDVYFSV